MKLTIGHGMRFMGLVLLTAQTLVADPLGTAFTYQGSLKNSGSPASGNFNMDFALFDVPTGGSALAIQSLPDVAVNNGLFTVQLDFGDAYNGDKRWLDITVNGMPLTPRQELTSAPYARFSSAPWATSGSNVSYSSGNVGIGTASPASKLDVEGTVKMSGLQLATAPGVGRLLTSDASGTGTWQALPPLGLESLSQDLQTQLLPLTSPNPSGISVIGTVTPGGAHVARSSGYAYATGNNTLRVFNLNNPASPMLVGSVTTGIGPGVVAVSDGYAYVTTNNSLQVFNVSNPTSPILTGSAGIGSESYCAAVSGDYVYIVFRHSNLVQVLNVSNPASPVSAGSFASGVVPIAIAVSGGYAYLVGSSFLRIFDVSNPASPTLVGNIGTAGNPQGVAISASYAYVVCLSANALQIFDVSNPASPTLAGSATTGNYPGEVEVSGGRAYVLSYLSNTLQLFNVSDPAAPTLTGSVAAGPNPISVAALNGYAYVINNSSLQVFGGATQFQLGAIFSGSVGIGTTSPDSKLSVVGDVDISGSRLFVGTSGNVGIGTATPGQKLSVAGTIESTSGGIKFPDGSTQATAAGAVLWAVNGNDISNDNSGNVGIGTTSPATKLHVTSNTDTEISIQSTAASGRRWTVQSSATAGLAGTFQIIDRTASTCRLLIDSSGNVGIGTTSPAQKLVVAGNICATGSIATCSDERYKKNITSLESGLSLVEKLRPVRFDWKREEFPDHKFTEGRQIGFIAQEVEEVLPQVVSTGSDGYKSVDYGRLTPVIVEAVKQIKCEKDEQIDSLRSENAELKVRLDRIESLINKVSN